MDGVSERLVRLIDENITNFDSGVIDPARTMDDLGLDSLDALELTIAVEEEWDIEITDDELDAIQTFGDAVALIERRIREGEEYMAGRRNRADGANVVAPVPPQQIDLPIEVVPPDTPLLDRVRELASAMAHTTLQEPSPDLIERIAAVPTPEAPRPPMRPAWRNGSRSGSGRRAKWHVQGTGVYPTLCGRVPAAEIAAQVILTRDEFLARRSDDSCTQCARSLHAEAPVAAVETDSATDDSGKPSRTLKFDLFTRSGTAEQPTYMVMTENIRTSIQYTDRFQGWAERLRDCRGEFEGHSCYSMTRDQLDRFLSSVKRIVVGRWGSGTRHVEWVRVGSKTRFPPELAQQVHIPDFPEHHVEDLAQHGSAFPAIAAAILGPVLGRKIIFVNEPQFSDRGGFQIYTANGQQMQNRHASHPHRLFGIEDKNGYPGQLTVYQPDIEHTTGVYIQDGQLSVAEVHPNGLFVLASLGDDFFGIRVFTRILQEAIRFFGSPEEYERVRVEAERAFRESQRRHIVGCAERAIRYVEQQHGIGNMRNVNRRENVRQQIQEGERRLRELHGEMFAIENANNNNTMERISREFDTLADHRFHLVNKVFFAHSGEFHMITDPIISYDRQTRKYHLLSQCEMIVDFPGNTNSRYYPGRGGVRIVQHVGPGQRAIPLPHCGSEGGVCFGNIRNEIDSLVAGFELQALASLVITFLQRPNVHDPDGRRVRNFPECPAPAAVNTAVIHEQHDDTDRRRYGL